MAYQVKDVNGVTHEAIVSGYAMGTRCGLNLVVDPRLSWHEYEEMTLEPCAPTTCFVCVVRSQ